MENVNFTVLFNDAGIIIATDGWAHSYEDECLAARDVLALLSGETTEDWDGNEPAAAQDARNGHFDEIVDGDNLAALLGGGRMAVEARAERSGAVNFRLFLEALCTVAGKQEA